MIVTVLFFLAACFYAIAGLGLLRLPDSLARLHAGTKASSLATVLALGAAFAHHGTLWAAFLCGACLLFVFLTAPLASHAIARCILHSRLQEISEEKPAPPPSSAPEKEVEPSRPDSPRRRSSLASHRD